MSRGGCCAVLSRSLAQFGPKPGPRKATGAQTPPRTWTKPDVGSLTRGNQGLDRAATIMFSRSRPDPSSLQGTHALRDATGHNRKLGIKPVMFIWS
jgi:hypothetical protein